MTNQLPDPSGCRVIILEGQYAGQEGVCLGPASEGVKWMVSPDSSNEIVPLIFEEEFGILVVRDI